MNLYSIKPNEAEDTQDVYYVVAKTYGDAVRKYKRRRTSQLAIPGDWKNIKEPSKVVLVCGDRLLLAGRD